MSAVWSSSAFRCRKRVNTPVAVLKTRTGYSPRAGMTQFHTVDIWMDQLLVCSYSCMLSLVRHHSKHSTFQLSWSLLRANMMLVCGPVRYGQVVAQAEVFRRWICLCALFLKRCLRQNYRQTQCDAIMYITLEGDGFDIAFNASVGCKQIFGKDQQLLVCILSSTTGDGVVRLRLGQAQSCALE